MTGPIKVRKPFLSFDDQTRLLESRELIDDEKNLTSMLKNLNYYRFSGFLLRYKSKRPDGTETYDGVKVSEVYKLYETDQNLRNILLDIIGIVEISVRTYIAYSMGSIYEGLGYLNSTNFIDPTEHAAFIKIIKEYIRYHSSVPFIKHYIDELNDKLPIWIVVEILTFEQLIHLYDNLLPDPKNMMMKEFVKISPAFFSKWLKQIKGLRNECAHFYRIYDANRQSITIPNAMKCLVLSGKTWHECSNSLFGYLCVMKFLINNETIWNDCLTRIRDFVIDNDGIISSDELGFPANWEEILDSVI